MDKTPACFLICHPTISHSLLLSIYDMGYHLYQKHVVINHESVLMHQYKLYEQYCIAVNSVLE